jgi:hypothetical protein
MSLTQPPTRGWHYTYQGASMASNADKHEKKLVGLFLFVCLFVVCGAGEGIEASPLPWTSIPSPCMRKSQLHCWWECKMTQPYWKKSLEVPEEIECAL